MLNCTIQGTTLSALEKNMTEYLISEAPTHRIHNEIIQKPCKPNGSQRASISFQYKSVGNLGVLHRILLKSFWFFHVESPEEDEHGRDESETEGQTPNGAEVVVSEAMGENKSDG
jgi:hypothetical protein